MSTKGIALLPFVFLALGCSFATAALKSQIDGQCKGIGVKGCPEIADGVIDYADGKEVEGEQKLLSAAAQNSPEKLRELASVIEPILDAADAETARKLKPVLAILQGSAGPVERSAPRAALPKERHAAGKTTERERPAPITVSAGPDFENMRAGMVNPSAEAQPCLATRTWPIPVRAGACASCMVRSC